MSDTTPERTVPADVERAIVNHHSAVRSYGRGTGDVNTVVMTTRALYAAVIAALEPDRGMIPVPWEFLVTMRNITQEYPPDGSIELVTEVLTNLIANDLTATSSTEGE